MAVALVATARATVVDIPATTTGYAWWNRDYQGYETSGKVYGNLELADVGSHFQDFRRRPFLKFALDTLPDSCLILSAGLNCYQYGYLYAAPTTVVKLIPDPVPDGQDVLWQIDHAPPLCAPESSLDGWQHRQFADSALPAIDSCRDVGWISLAIAPVSYWPVYECHAYGDSGALPPYLRVVYTMSGVNDVRGLRMSPLLTITPNPTTGSYVAVRYGSATGAVGKLTLRDALGGTVKSFPLATSGRAGLDLRGLAPGIYMATLEAGAQSVTRKLVITAR